MLTTMNHNSIAACGTHRNDATETAAFDRQGFNLWAAEAAAQAAEVLGATRWIRVHTSCGAIRAHPRGRGGRRHRARASRRPSVDIRRRRDHRRREEPGSGAKKRLTRTPPHVTKGMIASFTVS